MTIINNLMEELNEYINDNCDIIVRTIIDDRLLDNELKINIILTGLGKL